MDSHAVRVVPVGLGLLLALWVCVDPLISLSWLASVVGDAWDLRSFPYVLSLVLACSLAGALLLLPQVHWLWSEKERMAIVFVIIMGEFAGVQFGRFDVLEIATAILAGSWLILTLVERERTIQVSPVLFFTIAMTFLAILALVNRPPLSGLVALGEKFVIFFLMVDLIRDRSLIKTAVRLLIWTGACSAVVGIGQFLLFALWGKIYVLDLPMGEDPISVLKPTPLGLMLRATAFFSNPASLNDYLLMASGVTLFAIVSARTWGGRFLYAGAFLLMAIAIVLTWSTMALIALGLMLFILPYVFRPSLTIHYSAAALLLILVSYEAGLLEGAYRTLEALGRDSGSIRMSILDVAAASFQRNPLLGVGIQNFENVSMNFFEEGPHLKGYPVHNAFLQMATELGIFGGLLFLGIVVFVLMRLALVLRVDAGQEQWMFKGLLLGFVGIVVHMANEPMAYLGTLWLVIGVIEGAAITVLRTGEDGGGAPPSETRQDP